MKKSNVVFLVIVLVIGFAAVSTSLILNGTVGVASKQDDFDVIFVESLLDGEESDNVVIDGNKKSLTFTSKRLRELKENVRLDYKVKNTSTQYGANVTISCNNYGNDYIEITGEFDGKVIPLNNSVEIEAQEEKSGYINVELVKVYDDEDTSLSIKCEIVADATSKDHIVKVEQCDVNNPPVKELNSWLWTDNDCSKDMSIGDLLSINTESFYVYNVDGDDIKALSQYNLYVGNSCTDGLSSSCTPLQNATGLQDSRAVGYGKNPRIGTVKFGNSNSYSGSLVQTYVNQYATKLSKINSNIKNVRLITKEELVKLGCDETCLTAPKFVCGSSYWTSTAQPGYDNQIWMVYSFGTFGHVFISYDFEMGVRPVIEISKSVFE